MSGTRPLSCRVVSVKWCREESISSFALNRKEKELGFRKRCGRTYRSWRPSQHSTCSHPRTCQTRICKYTWLHRPTANDASANDRRWETRTLASPPAHRPDGHHSPLKHSVHCKTWESTEMCEGKIENHSI